jgi:hypothetical protein
MKLQSLKNPIKYHNISVLHPNGTLMFKASQKLISWYLKRDLIKEIDPNTYQFTFEPNGMGKADEDFFLSDISNICVVCGAEEGLSRHHIVPHCYRRHLNRSHDHYDILLLCLECHEKYELAADQFRNELSIEYFSPKQGVLPNEKHYIKLRKISSKARILLKYQDKVPEARQIEMLEEIKEFLGSQPEKSDLENLANTYKNEREGFVSHGEMVVKKLQTPEEVAGFEERWREHFVTTMNPHFLPDHWEIKRK